MENTNGHLNVVLVHGGFVDGSGWEDVHKILTQDGHHVGIVQNPTLSLADDVVATRRVIDAQDGPVVLVGHSYGGAVITEAGNDPKVPARLHRGVRSRQGRVRRLAHQRSATRRACPADPAAAGRIPVPRQHEVPRLFAADVDPDKAAFMADSQVPWGVAALSGAIASRRGKRSRAGTSWRPKTG